MAKASPEDLKALFDTQRGWVLLCAFLLCWFLRVYISLSLFGARARENIFSSPMRERDAMLNFFEKMMID